MSIILCERRDEKTIAIRMIIPRRTKSKQIKERQKHSLNREKTTHLRRNLEKRIESKTEIPSMMSSFVLIIWNRFIT